MSQEGGVQHVRGKCRVMIIGRTGSGKSSLANKLLGRPDRRFTNPLNAEQETAARNPEDPFFISSNVSVTKTCQLGTSVRNGILMTVVDTPGLFDTDKEVDNKHVQFELTRGLLLAEGKPHAFIIVVELGRVTQEVQNAFQTCVALFGTSNLIVAFSKGEQLEDDGLTIETSATLPGNDILKVILEVVRANHRYVVVTKIENRRQAEVDGLMEKINEVSNRLTRPWINPKLQNVADEFQRQVTQVKDQKNCSEDVAAKEVRNNIVQADSRNAKLVELAKKVSLFLAGCIATGAAVAVAGPGVVPAGVGVVTAVAKTVQ